MSDVIHAATCIYCGEHVIYDAQQVDDMEEAVIKLVEHDGKCPKNPLVKQRDQLRDALYDLLDRYTELVNCGDCGIWDCEKEIEVVEARAALAAADVEDV